MPITLLLLAVFSFIFGGNISAAAAEKNEPFLVRLRAITVQPVENGTPSTIGGDVTASASAMPELDFSYFFNDHFAAELILAVTPHRMGAINTSLGNVDLGNVWLLPPTVTAQYHFTPQNGMKPYLGAGVNYTVFFGEDSGQFSDVKYEDGFGYALQAGADYDLGKGVGFNVDIKKIYLNTDVSINGGAVTADVDLDPWILGTGVTMSF